MVAELEVDELDLLRTRTSAKWTMFPSDVLPLFIAEMDYRLAGPVQAALVDAVVRGDTGYARPGAELAQSLAGFAQRRWAWSIEPADVRAVADVGVAARELLRVLVQPGDRVAFSTPVYHPFFEWINAVGAVAADARLRVVDGRQRLDLDGLRQIFATGAKVYLLCNPANPSGRVHDADELIGLAAVAAEFGVTVISDEIHAALVLDGARFTPFTSVPGGAQVGISLMSASKAWNVAGLKCAQIVAQSTAMHAVLDRLDPDLSWGVGQLGVVAAIAAYTAGDPWLDSLLSTLHSRRDQLAGLLREVLPSVSWQPPQAGYLAWLDCGALGLGDDPAQAFRQRGRVALEPGPIFGAAGRGHVRLNYATSSQILHDAVHRMAATVEHGCHGGAPNC